MPEVLEIKQRALDLLTIFSGICDVRFCHLNSRVEVKRGWWCTVCKWANDKSVIWHETYQNFEGIMKRMSKSMGSGRHFMLDPICLATSISVATMQCTRSIVLSRDWQNITMLYHEQLSEQGIEPKRKRKKANKPWMEHSKRCQSPVSFWGMSY